MTRQRPRAEERADMAGHAPAAILAEQLDEVGPPRGGGRMIAGAAHQVPRPTPQEVVDALYDTAWSAVRGGDLPTAESALEALDDVLRVGGPLPTPWMSARPPRPHQE